MRGLISTITTIAAAIHFTFGCCLHLPHAEAAVGCCPHAATPARADGCSDDGSHEHGVAERGHDAACESGVHRCPADDTGHDCDGCHCAATTDESVDDPLASCLDRVAVTADRPLATTVAGGRRPERCTRDPVASVIRPPLFERLTL